MMKRTVLAVIFAAVMFAAGFGTRAADSADAYRVRMVRCGSFAEDSVSHVRLVRFDVVNGTARITYRCERRGY